MRILHLGKYYPPAPGGIEAFLGHLAAHQAAGGDQVLVLAHGLPGDAPQETPVPGLEVRRAPVRLTLGGYAPVAPAMPGLFLRALGDFRPDVLHAHAPNPAVFWPALWPGKTPLVLHWHADVDFPPGRGPSAPLLACWRGLEALALHRAAAVIATSQAYLDASPTLAAHRRKCRVAPLSLAEPAPAPAPPEHPALGFLRRETRLRVLAVGRLAHYKGLDILARAVLDVSGASLCLVGEGEERPALEALAASPAASGRILLAGAVDDAVLDACYRHSDVLCLSSTSRSEAFGLVLLEAMSRGLPCVATLVPGSAMAEVVRHGESGLLVAPGSPGALAEALARLAADPGLRRRMGRAGRERFARHYALDGVAGRIRAVYEDVLAQAGAR